MNIRFGLYLIPDATEELYKIGSKVVGYDVRGRLPLTPPDFIQPKWIALNKQFGFHATITDAITVAEEQIPSILEKTEQLLSCLRPDNRYILTKERVGFWRDSSNMAAVIMKPNRSVELLHDVLVASLHPLGFSSEYYENYQANPDAFQPANPAAIQKTKQFYSPYIFDEFVPHFTCIHSYDGDMENRTQVENELEILFENIDHVEFKKIAFVTQKEGEPYFTIEKELRLSSNE
jgi:2'-5' RNA ligase